MTSTEADEALYARATHIPADSDADDGKPPMLPQNRGPVDLDVMRARVNQLLREAETA